MSDALKRELEGVVIELASGIEKHGNWDGYSVADMIKVIVDELSEVVDAADHDDVFSPHGMVVELRQVAACCIKMSMRLNRL